MLIISRVVQGAGGALVSPAALSMLTTTNPEGPAPEPGAGDLAGHHRRRRHRRDHRRRAAHSVPGLAGGIPGQSAADRDHARAGRAAARRPARGRAAPGRARYAPGDHRAGGAGRHADDRRGAGRLRVLRIPVPAEGPGLYPPGDRTGPGPLNGRRRAHLHAAHPPAADPVHHQVRAAGRAGRHSRGPAMAHPDLRHLRVRHRRAARPAADLAGHRPGAARRLHHHHRRRPGPRPGPGPDQRSSHCATKVPDRERTVPIIGSWLAGVGRWRRRADYLFGVHYPRG